MLTKDFPLSHSSAHLQFGLYINSPHQCSTMLYVLFFFNSFLLFWNTVFLHLTTFFFPQPLSLTSPPLSICKCLSDRDHSFIFGSIYCPLLILSLHHLTHMLLAINYNPVTYPFCTFSSLELCTQLPAKCSHLDVSARVPAQNVLY